MFEGVAYQWGEFEQHLVVPEKGKAGRKPRAEARATAQAADGESFFSQVNSAALKALASWVPKLWPAARELGSGVWRISPEDRGRPDLEEDISFDPENGGHDFGLEKPLTPIDAVAEHKPCSNTVEAALWLCEAMALDPTSLGWSRSDDALERVNREYATAWAGRNYVILREHEDENGQDVVDFVTKESFDLAHKDQFVQVGGRWHPLADTWLSSKRRRRYKGVVFSPCQERTGYFNLWRGWGVTPDPGPHPGQ
jgi:hypothetical protein